MANNEFGDFQTNPQLAARIVGLLAGLTDKPATIVEPTCGHGNFVQAALDAFPVATVHGLEIGDQYVRDLEKRFQFNSKFVLHHQNYFDFAWYELIENMVKPVWVIGNPPWVTNTHLMKIESGNLPKKMPQPGLRGFEAQTGKSNFDISESMIRDWFDWCATCGGSLAVVCKTSVARKILAWWWKSGRMAPHARLYNIDARAEFGVTVAACVLVCTFGGGEGVPICEVFADLDASAPRNNFGLIDGFLVSDAAAYRRHRVLLGRASPQWRSGVKHDVSDVLELRWDGSELRNKSGELVEIEPDLVYPLMKGSDLSRDVPLAKRAIILPQRYIGEDCQKIEQVAPQTWDYLVRHRHRFGDRKSVIYRKGGEFSIFGVGEYSFRPWKIAIGALYKNLTFRLIGPAGNRPVIFDDTVYFIGFDDEASAKDVFRCLNSADAREFLSAMIFWDDMRPIKTEILNRLDIPALELLVAA